MTCLFLSNVFSLPVRRNTILHCLKSVSDLSNRLARNLDNQNQARLVSWDQTRAQIWKIFFELLTHHIHQNQMSHHYSRERFYINRQHRDMISKLAAAFYLQYTRHFLQSHNMIEVDKEQELLSCIINSLA